MERQGQEMRSEERSYFGSACHGLKAIVREEAGVTAIEYSLLAALIVIVVLTGIVALGGGVFGLWTNVSDAVTDAI